MILYLQHHRGDGDVDTYHLKPGRRYHLGRGSGCEVRILDLKLSRKHAAVEWNEGEWRFTDLCSTNGCKVDGEAVSGSVTLTVGRRIEIGQTTLSVLRILAPDETDPEDEEVAMEPPEGEPVIPTDGTGDQPRPEARIRTPSFEEDELPAPAASSTAPLARKEQAPVPVPVTPPEEAVLEATAPTLPRPPVFEPTPGPVQTLTSPPTEPGTGRRSRPPAVKGVVIQAVPPTPPPTAPAEPETAPPPVPQPPPAPAPVVEERTFFITVLGRRIGPLTRAAARELKARELKGTISSSDLDQYPQG